MTVRAIMSEFETGVLLALWRDTHLSLQEIGARFNVTGHTVKRLAHAYGVKKQPGYRKPLPYGILHRVALKSPNKQRTRVHLQAPVAAFPEYQHSHDPSRTLAARNMDVAKIVKLHKYGLDSATMAHATAPFGRCAIYSHDVKSEITWYEDERPNEYFPAMPGHHPQSINVVNDEPRGLGVAEAASERSSAPPRRAVGVTPDMQLDMFGPNREPLRSS